MAPKKTDHILFGFQQIWTETVSWWPVFSVGHLPGTEFKAGASLPDSIDWVSKGAVTDPKNQGKCAMAWGRNNFVSSPFGMDVFFCF